MSEGHEMVWIDGELVHANDAHVSPFDHGLLTGDGVFETLRIERGTPFAWRRHMERLAHSADGLGLPLPTSVGLRSATDAVIAANDASSARLRITITGGIAPLGSERCEVFPTVIIATAALPQWPQTADLVTVPWPRNERGALAGIKTISYGENVRALAYAHDHGGSEAVFCNTAGALCEGTGSNIFLVQSGDPAILITPSADSGCLAGVTRALVLELAAACGLAIEERQVEPGELSAATEVFITSTTRVIQAVRRVDEMLIPDAPGPVTRTLADAFTALVARDLNP